MTESKSCESKTVSSSVAERRNQYEPPQLVVLGSLVEMTMGSGADGYDLGEPGS